MAVLDFAAHTIDFLEVNEGHVDEETGDFIKGSETWLNGLCKCDVVPNGKAETIPLPDGSLHPYSYVLYNLPRSCRELKYGDRIKVHFYDSETDVKEFVVLGFHRYQMQCKVWV